MSIISPQMGMRVHQEIFSSPHPQRLSDEKDSLVTLNHINVALNGVRVLHDVCWELKRGENWAFFGPNGAGKSTLLRLLRGEIWPDPVNGGTRIYCFDGKPTESPIGIKRRMAIVSAEQQQRYTRMHGRKYGDDFSPFITVRDIVFSGLLDSDLVTRKPKPVEIAKVNRVMREMGIDDLADVPFDKLSQGQLRKALIARAVIGKPDVMILDEVGVGLDAQSRHALLEMIQRVAEGGTQILMTTHRRDELIPAISHVLELKCGKVTCAEPLTPTLSPWKRGSELRFQPIAALPIAHRSTLSHQHLTRQRCVGRGREDGAERCDLAHEQG